MRERLVGLGAILLAFGYWWPAFRSPEATGFGDWQMIHHNWEVGYVAVTRYHEWPLFDPYHCGGVSMVGNPESQDFGPLFLLAFVVGTTLATKIYLALHTAVALVAAYAYARRVARLSTAASVLSAVVFAGSGFFAWHGAGGHATFAPFAFLPALHLALREGERRPLPIVLGALALALAVAEGGTYPYPYMLVSLGIATLYRCMSAPAHALASIRALALTMLGSLGFAAYRLVPIARTLARVPRTIGSVDHSSLLDLVPMLTARDHDWHFIGHEFVWPEYGTYVGFPVLVLAALGALRMRARFSREVALAHVTMSIAVVALVLGNIAPHAPWRLLRELPVFDSLRVPSRFLVVLTFHLGVLAGLGLDRLDPRRSRGGLRGLVVGTTALIVVGIATDITLVTRPIVDRWDRPPIDDSFVAPERFFRFVPYDAVYASLPRRNEATTLCYVGGMNWPVSRAIRIGPGPQAWPREDAATVRITHRTASTIDLDIDATRPTRVVINQNYDPAFRANVGRVVDDAGMLAVDVNAGHHALHMAFSPDDAMFGLALSFATALVAIASLSWRRPNRRATHVPS